MLFDEIGVLRMYNLIYCIDVIVTTAAAESDSSKTVKEIKQNVQKQTENENVNWREEATRGALHRP